MQKLTKRVVDEALARYDRAPGESFTWDSTLPGFGLRITQAGSASYILQFRVGAGRQRRMVIGRAHVLTPEEARRLARKALVRVAEGGDPAEERRTARRRRETVTVAALAKRWQEEHAAQRLRPSSIARADGLLKNHILPVLGRVDVTELDRAHAAKLQHAMRANRTNANRGRAMLSALCHYAERVGLRPQGSNPTRFVAPFREEKRRRFLSGEELSALGAALERIERANERPCDVAAVAAVRLLLMTAARAGEILSLRWEHVDLEHGTLRLPTSKTGQKTVTLGPVARALLEELPRCGPYVIAGRRPDRPLVGLHKIWRRILADAGIAGVRLHDLRRTAASAGASAGLSLEIVGQLLGHSQVATTRRYSYLFDRERRDGAERMESSVVSRLGGRTGPKGS